MTHFTLRAASAALLLVIGGPAFAADPPKPGVPLAPVALRTYRAREVLGTRLSIQNNVPLGTVDDIVFDEAGNLDYLIGATGDNKLITVPFDLEKRTGIVNITPELYKTSPTDTVTTYRHAPADRTAVDKMFGPAPRQLRRLERADP
jgi:hypothetical protein